MGLDTKNGTWQQTAMASGGAAGPIVCMPTLRRFARSFFRCNLYEAQDVLTSTASVDLVPLELSWARRFKEEWLRLPLYHDPSRKLMFLNPGLRPLRLTRGYDLFIAVCQNYWDLPYLNAIHEWRGQCRTSICWLDEIWAASISGLRYWLHALDQFDHIFVGCKGSVSALSNAINRPCHWLPPAVDALRFSPYPAPPVRTIDVYSIGRRREHVHQALLQAAGCGEIFYLYDTYRGSADSEMYSYEQHRDLFANVAKRSRCFLVAPSKMDSPGETHGQVEVGYRYYEGAAAGAVMVGERPSCDVFTEMFPWPDVVIPIRPDGTDAIDTVADLARDPERLSDISRRNAAEALLRHDWVYRWKEMFREVGVEPTPGMLARERHLRNLAALAFGEDALTVRHGMC